MKFCNKVLNCMALGLGYREEDPQALMKVCITLVKILMEDGEMTTSLMQ